MTCNNSDCSADKLNGVHFDADHDPVFVYMTASSHEEAMKIARALVQSKLAACANVIQEVSSVYRWQDTIHEDQEHIIIAKTQAVFFDRLCDRVREIHSYDCPCIVALPVKQGFPPYLKWLANQLDI